MPEVCVHYLPVAQPAAYAVSPVGELQYAGGQIWLVEGTTGRDRLCNNYDVSRQRCRAWAGVVSHRKVVTVTAAPQQEDTTK
jgi:hypothetical protein